MLCLLGDNWQGGEILGLEIELQVHFYRLYSKYMHFVWCESVENFFRDKTLLRERKSVCVSQIQRYYSLCVHFP